MAVVLDETGVSGEKEVWAWTGGKADEADKAKPPKTTLTDAELDEIGVTERDYAKMDYFERLAYRQKLKGHDVLVVDESDDDDFDLRQFIDPKMRAYLDAMTLDENWRDKQG